MSKITNTASGLFKTVKVGDILCSNGIAMAPLTRGRSTVDGHVPTKLMMKYYEQRASAGLIISEATNINQEGVGWYKSPGIWNEEQVKAWEPITKAVHKKNGKIVCQLWHTGRKANSVLSGMEIVSASPIPLTTYTHGPKGTRLAPETPREMSFDDIQRTVNDYGIAAKNAMLAGFDGVEIHGANGYLIDQFIQSKSNKRTDEYGGSIENRLRFLREVIDSVVDSIGASKVGVRFSPHGGDDMGSEDNHEAFTEAIKLATRKNLAYIHMMDGVFGKVTEACPPFTLKHARDAANQVTQAEREDRVVIMGNSGYDKDKAEARLAEGNAEMIAFGIPYISNPDLVERFYYDLELAPPAEFKYWFGVDEADEEKGYTAYANADYTEVQTKPKPVAVTT
eukprot:Pgem_evm1s427